MADAQQARSWRIRAERSPATNLMIVRPWCAATSAACDTAGQRCGSPRLFSGGAIPGGPSSGQHHLPPATNDAARPATCSRCLSRRLDAAQTPKVQAMGIIDELEPQRTQRLVWSVGYLSYCGNARITSITIPHPLTALAGTAVLLRRRRELWRIARKRRNIRNF
ncbi:hypothetical protein LNP74_27875 [Klebsiella pneumoniae subsp. pneumoniae]|nr:hypothetical protein [Klebsiella pneumoniae subsp. pneumoniae]